MHCKICEGCKIWNSDCRTAEENKHASASIVVLDEMECLRSGGALTCGLERLFFPRGLKVAGMVDILSERSAEFTIFAPTDDAFEAAMNRLGISLDELISKKYALAPDTLQLTSMQTNFSPSVHKLEGKLKLFCMLINCRCAAYPDALFLLQN